MNRLISLIILSVLASSGCCFAQANPVFNHLNTNDGLSNNRVRCIIADSRGFMWFGTDGGLNRFDGKEFIVFKNIPGDSASISGNEIHDFFEDASGIIWIATTDGGLCSYDYRTGKFAAHKNIQKGIDVTMTNFINSIAEDTKGRFWVGTDKAGLYLFDKKTRTFNPQSSGLNMGEHPDRRNRAYAFNDIAVDSNGTAYFGTLGFSLQVMKDKLIPTHGGKAHPFPAQTISCIFIDSRERVWMGAWDNALHSYNDKTNVVSTIHFSKDEPFTYSGDEIISINEDTYGWLWLGTRRNGLYLYNPGNGSVINFGKNQHDAGSPVSNTIRCIYRDSQNRMWMGTDAGIDIYDPLLHQFEVTYLDKIINDASDDETVYDFLDGGNRFYIATAKGLLVKNNKDEKFFRKTFTWQNESLNITKLYKDKKGRIFLGTNKTLFLLNPEDFSIKTVNCFFTRSNDLFDFYNIESSRIVSISENRWHGHDVLWISPYGHGVAVFDAEKLSGFISVLNIPDDMENLIHKIFVDSKNNLWLLCAVKGISYNVHYNDPDTMDIIWNIKTFPSKSIPYKLMYLHSEYLTHDEKNSNSINSNNVFDMVENNDGTYWITTSGGGLQLFDPKLQNSKPGKIDLSKISFQSFPSDRADMRGMLKDKNGNLWIMVSGGIEFFDVRKKQFHHFGFKDGIPNEGLRDYFYQSSDGFAYAGGNGYFIRFKPENIKLNSASPKVALTHFKIFDDASDSLLLNKEINLSWKKNFFSFEFAALNYTNPEANHFAYMLEGVDPDWIYSGSRNFASYTNVQGGHYVFKVKAANNNGTWNEEGISIPVYIKPPIWQYAWFYPSIIILLAAGGYFLYRYRVKNIRKQQEEKLKTEIEAQERERTRIATDLHDDFGTRISALKIYMSTLEKYLDTKSDEAKSVKESAKSIVNEAMADLRTLLMNLSPKTLDMHGFYPAVHDLVSRLNHTGMFEVELNVSPTLNRFDKKYELALYRITQELINNSIKHAQCTEICIQLMQRDRILVLNYSDNGKGFNPFGEGRGEAKGFGLRNIENRVLLINGKINWDIQQGRGVNVLVEIPFTN